LIKLNYPTKVIIPLTLIILSGFCCLGQAQRTDSLYQELRNAKHDTTRCQLYFALGDYFQLSNLDSAIYYFQKYHKLAEAQGLQKDQANALRLIGISYGKQGIFNEALDWLNRALSLNLKIGNSIEAAKCYSNIGIIHHEKGSYSLALEYFHKSLDISEAIGDKRRISYMYNNIGNLHESQRSYDLALEYFQKSLQVKKDLGDKRGMSASYHNIGVIQRKKGEYDLAINNYRESLRICEELDDNIGMSNTYSSLASIFIDKGELDAANEHYQKALRLSETFGEKHTTSRILGNIAMLHRRMGNLAEVPIEREKQYHQALKYAERGLEIAQEIDALPMISFHYNTISNIWEGMGNNAKALAYSRLFDQTRDSLFNEEKTRAITEMQTRYETEKKQQEIENQKLLIEKKDFEYYKQRNRLNIIILGSLLLFLSIILALSVLFQKVKTNKIISEKNRILETAYEEIKTTSEILSKQNEILQSQNEKITLQHKEIEEQRNELANLAWKLQEEGEEVEKHRVMLSKRNKEITDSIKYAQRIQNAVLPSAENLQEIFEEFFIIYKPKSIVSGDFYWATRIEELTIFCIADCTGHGVPGAFMSMLGVSFLNEIVRKNLETNPSEILNDIRQHVMSSLTECNENFIKLDGMDMGLCVLNNKTLTLQFAGANIPCWIVPKLVEKKMNVNHGIIYNGLVELKANRMPLAFYEQMEPFTHTVFKLSKGDTIYLASDGFADQFGGPELKKFQRSRLVKIISSSNIFPLNQQKDLFENIFNEWKGHNNQTDDVTLLGVKV